MFPSVKRKTAGDIIYPQCFFQLTMVEKIFPPGAQENAENFRHEERNQESTFTLQMNQLLQN
jgi:hypothetical protein